MSCCGCFVCVHENQAAIVQQCGKFDSVKHAGCACVPCCLGYSVASREALCVRQLDVDAETKTLDSVFVTLRVAVQYKIRADKVYEAVFKFSEPQRQIRAYVCDVIRSAVPKITLDQVFETKEDIANSIKDQLSKTLEDVGYDIKEALVTDIDPDPKVKAAMNDINANQRLRQAAVEKAEAEKIMAVKKAEAEAESKYLSGVGVARQRKAIADGHRDSVLTFTENIRGTTSKDAMDLILITQYFDTLRDVGSAASNATIFLPHTPGTVHDIADQIRLSAGAYSNTHSDSPSAPDGKKKL